MKTRSILFLSLIALFGSLYGQSLPDSSGIWTIARISMGSYNFNATYAIQGDTVIDEITYKAIYTTPDSIFDPAASYYHSAVRDSANRWLFIPRDSTEKYLLYDFSLEEGDTVEINNPWEDGLRTLIALNVDSVELSDGYYKRIGVGIYDPPSGQPHVIDHWIEGVGSVNGLFYSAWYIMDLGYQLLCFHRNDTLVYLNSPDGTCGYIFVGIDDRISSSTVKIYPNPVVNVLTIKSSVDRMVRIYDINGSNIYSGRDHTIDLSWLNTGMYFIRVYDDKNQVIATDKLLKKE